MHTNLLYDILYIAKNMKGYLNQHVTNYFENIIVRLKCVSHNTIIIYCMSIYSRYIHYYLIECIFK